MKKIMILAAVVCATMFANAASFNWRLQTGADYANMDVYAVSGTTAATVLAVLKSTDSANWTSTLAGVTPVTITGTNTRAGVDGLSTGIEADDNIVYVIVNGAIADGNDFYVVNDFSVPAENLFEPPSTGTKLTIKTSEVGFAGQGTFTAVPEPTSGLLMLVGLAGLALRRRRA